MASRVFQSSQWVRVSSYKSVIFRSGGAVCHAAGLFKYPPNQTFRNVTYIVNWIIKKPLCEPEVQDVRNFSTKTYNQRPKQYRQAYETIFLEEHKTGRFEKPILCCN